MTLTASLVSLFKHLSKRRLWQLLGLFFLMLVSALAEMASLGSVVPFMALLADPSMVNKYPLIQILFRGFGIFEDNIILLSAILFCLITVIAALIRMLLLWCSMRYSFGLGADIGREVYSRTLYQQYNWHASRNSSEILASIEKVSGVVGGIVIPLLQGAVGLMMTLGILLMLLAIDLTSALIAVFGFTLLYGITTLTLRKQLEKNSKSMSTNSVYRLKAVQEGLGGIRDVLIDGTQEIFINRFSEFDYALRRAQSSNIVIGSSPRYVIEAIGMVLIVILAYLLIQQEGGLVTVIPILGALAIGAQKLLPQMQLVYASWSAVKGNRNQLEDVLELLNQSIDTEYIDYFDKQDFGYLEKSKINFNSNFGDFFKKEINKPLISLKNIKFSYKPKSPMVLDNISFEIPHGSSIGIIGSTGSGKSTVTDLIMGLLDPVEGTIEINGKTLNALNRRIWQQRIAHVPQSIYLSDSSIAENIAFGISYANIDTKKLKSAAEKAQISDFIDSLPAKFDTFVGERGVRLSGGQRQRIGIARALYKESEIIVFDEATSSLDNATELEVMKSIQSLNKDLTLIIIAHRLTTLKECSLIIEMNQGKIKRSGTYYEIIGTSK